MASSKNSKQRIRVHNFYRTHCGKDDPDSAQICAALTAAAPSYRPNAFSTLKSQIVADQLSRSRSETAEKIRGLINPVTKPGSSIPRKPKPSSIRKVSNDDTNVLFKHLRTAGHNDEAAALVLANFLGVRPCEMRTITVIGHEVTIIGGKKSAQLNRGADRTVYIENAKVLKTVKLAAKIMAQCERSDAAIRDRFRKECRELWPRRKKHPTLKSFRHNFNSVMKAVGGDPKTRAYIMGHQSEESQSVYGDRRSGGNKSLYVSPAAGMDLSKIRAPKSPPRFGAGATIIGKIQSPKPEREHWIHRFKERRAREISS